MMVNEGRGMPCLLTVKLMTVGSIVNVFVYLVVTFEVHVLDGYISYL